MRDKTETPDPWADGTVEPWVHTESKTLPVTVTVDAATSNAYGGPIFMGVARASRVEEVGLWMDTDVWEQMYQAGLTALRGSRGHSSSGGGPSCVEPWAWTDTKAVPATVVVDAITPRDAVEPVISLHIARGRSRLGACLDVEVWGQMYQAGLEAYAVRLQATEAGWT